MIDVFVRGGPLMWPILGASIVALAAVVNRLWYLASRRGDSAALGNSVAALARQGRIAEAREACAGSRAPVAPVLSAGLSAWGLAQEEVERRMEQAAAEELGKAEARLPLLATMVAVLPMLGFLGTILGLIEAFTDWSRAGADVRVEQLAAGISQAMITTGAGLVTSIPYVVAYNAFAGFAGRIARSLNAGGSELSGAYRLRAPPPDGGAQ